ncbi:hypothetical protein M011DRAFT_464158 [Sporormia fimetaria CBS 119925]|uniref:Protein CSN12 homolog n=1 Tax=Sporormia fimetaria CBS 119925 TaxID=1340428 RepID=A0A6A6VPA9_9PLEO|nr:hypothetical protein M011DRAFT_464158 [Sporormia fimetaria CBS 119925]
MQAALEPFRLAHAQQQAFTVAEFLSPIPPPNNPARLYEFHRASNFQTVEQDIRNALRYGGYRLNQKESVAWPGILVSYWKAIHSLLRAEEARNQGTLGARDLVEVYDAWKELTNHFLRHTSNGALPPWTLVCMYRTANYLRIFAAQADAQLAKSKESVTFDSGLQDDIATPAPRSEKLEETARIFNRIFALCLNDRNPDMSQSRKWGTYYMANLQFKTYFKLKNVSLSKNIVRSINAQSDLPSFEAFPAAHRVTYNYYVGVLAFLQEDYNKAEEHLTEAWNLCLPESLGNQERILTYLIPTRLITAQTIPTPLLLSSYPRLQKIFGPLVTCIKRGDLHGFDTALAAAEDALVRRRIYLTLERGRDLTLRNLLRKVFLAAGYEELKEGQTERDRIRKSRIPLSWFAAALRMSSGAGGEGLNLEDEEIECLIANQIYKGMMKGYISREHSMVVLNKKGAFPGTGV